MKIDFRRDDLEIYWTSGEVSKQLTPFKHETADWNCDGDEYELFGACFTGKHSGKDFRTIDDLEYLVEEGYATIQYP